MGFWDLFRKKKEEPVIENERVSVESLGYWLSNKKDEIEKQEKLFLQPIKRRILQLMQELKEETSVLKKVDVDEKKAEGKIKLVVKENLDNYVYYVEKLSENLGNIDSEKDMIEKINSVFSDFRKKSRTSYEKATFLIGKELANVKTSIRVFFKDLENLIKENQSLIERLKVISPVEESIRKFEEVKKTKTEIEKNISDYGGEISKLEKEIGAKEGQIEKLKKSKKFIIENKKKEDLVKKKVELENEIANLRMMIDFKSLTNFFHSFEKEMKVVKAFKENFKENFQKNNGDEISSLLQDAKIENVEIIDKIEEIKKRREEIKGVVFDDIGLEELESGISKIRTELKVLGSKKKTEIKKEGKVEKNLNDLIRLLKRELIKINVEVI
jgi:DNA repair exonuclease SbcCD ATPase subunit